MCLPQSSLRAATLLVLTTLATAQLDLPDRRRTPPGQGEGQAGEDVRELPRRPRGDLAPREGGRLDLPPSAAPPASPPAGAVEGAAPSQPADLGPAACLADLASVRTLDDPRLLAAAQTLRLAGPDGLEAARRALPSQALGTLVAAGRHLVVAGSPDDRRAVAERLRGELPAAAAGTLLDALAAGDPVTASPTLLVELLDHPASAMRQAAQRALERQRSSGLVPLLASRLASPRADTRLRALHLLAGIDEPGVVPLFLERLSDPSPKVAATVVDALSLDDSPGVDQLLRERALAEGRLDRGAAFALLALVEREDRRGSVLLTLDDVPVLLHAHKIGQPVLAGAAAAALAGIGFRNPASPATAWLDLEVPHTLVRLGSGAEFHNDFSALQPIALRRLALISGEDFGGEGLAWRRWWTENARGFHARRAVIDVAPGTQDRLSVVLVRGGRPVASVCGLRSENAEREDCVLLGDEQCAELLELLRAEGALGLERLPRRRPDGDEKTLSLRIALGTQAKRFDHPRSDVPAWITRVEEHLEALVQEHSWQRFRDPRRFATRRAFFAEEGPWWSVEHAPAERDRRLATLVLGWMERARDAERDVGLDELERLLAEPGVARPEDVDPLIALAADEEQYGARLERLVDLALLAAAARAGDAAPAAGRGALEAGESSALQGLLARHGEVSLGSLGRVLFASGSEGVRAASSDPDPLVRRAAAHAAAHDRSDAGTRLLLGLAADEDWSVCASAIEGLGERPSPAVRAFLRGRLEEAPTILRPALLRAVGRVGGEGARDLLVLGLADEDPRLQLAAVEGLAELADPATASLLASILVRDRGPTWSEPAHRGLLRIGRAAWPQLLRMAETSSSRGQRDAALLLSEQGVPDAAPILIELFTIDPTDAAVAEELCVLSCVDLRGEPDPAQAWWDWWELVVHDDSLAWLRAAIEREGLRAPTDAELRGEGSASGARLLARICEGEAPGQPSEPLVERARRELQRLLGGSVAIQRGRAFLVERDGERQPVEAAIRARWGTPDAGGAR